MFTLVTGIVGRWRAVCVTALQRPNSDAAAIRIVVGIAAASLSVTPLRWLVNRKKFHLVQRLKISGHVLRHLSDQSLPSRRQDIPPFRWAFKGPKENNTCLSKSSPISLNVNQQLDSNEGGSKYAKRIRTHCVIMRFHRTVMRFFNALMRMPAHIFDRNFAASKIGNMIPFARFVATDNVIEP
ncbi:unnamed protein product [Ranitomeya imitator]|uniref:Uncharacterized protein n=1 Tax=Ranitomeya imitator TaxID=111125 RepID=A0ABN9M3T1_9NEOB|nr:unnamed protein product [Ranitomeya imitator]